MALSAPIFQLKRTAKSLSSTQQISLNEALNHVAAGEGFRSWSELASSPLALSSPVRLFNELIPGDLLLLGGRPRQGKTAMALKLIVEAMKKGHHGVFFTLEYNEQDVAALFTKISIKSRKFDGLFELDTSDNIDAQYIIQRMKTATSGTVLAIDVKGGKDAGFKFLNALRLFTISNNFADAKSIVTHPATTTHQRLPQDQKDTLGITGGLVRISAGLEDAGDLIEDLLAGLSAI